MGSEKIDSKNLHSTKRNLPHFQIGGSWYFITFRTNKSFILTPESRDIVKSSIVKGDKKRYQLSPAVVMPDHVHIIPKPLEKPEDKYFSLSEILKPIKGGSARAINQL